MWTSGHAAWSRPHCRIVHGFLLVNMAVLLASQASVYFAWDQRDLISKPWFFVSVGLIFLHIFAAFFWAWVDGEPIQWGSGSIDSGSDNSSGWSDGGSGTDGGGSGGDGGGSSS